DLRTGAVKRVGINKGSPRTRDDYIELLRRAKKELGIIEKKNPVSREKMRSRAEVDAGRRKAAEQRERNMMIVRRKRADARVAVEIRTFPTVKLPSRIYPNNSQDPSVEAILEGTVRRAGNTEHIEGAIIGIVKRHGINPFIEGRLRAAADRLKQHYG
ncbi:MAG: hypothetical protein NUV57_03435, partial [archaeon]|nr:hypothetical protein [archaeon]